MTTKKVLVLGATGPSGISLLRELLYRKYSTVAYVRSPSKIPDDISSNSLLTVIKGAMDDRESFTRALSGVDIILSLLGPTFGSPISPFEDYYRDVVFPAMRDNNVKRIIASSTVSAPDPKDSFVFRVTLMKLLVRVLAPSAIPSIQATAKVFQEEATDLEWTLFRFQNIVGKTDEESWKKDREGAIHAGYLGDSKIAGWSNRNAIARWMVDLAENGQSEWDKQMPAVGQISG
ncbi:unnamed protein product [Clonostachys rosea f. rosea IK726]|uniref:NAD(P)-binding domain-containing protein n=2 Tax=Bionectria ochroleuca TaxID=29856 RepID=A0A0B7KGB0_BIOOC|nr:unnamed protein product [Clonostachys rosea f. rosea IK726]